jgi:alanine racemase
MRSVERTMRDPSVIEVDLTAVTRNMRVLRRIVGSSCGICPVVKADAYGLGAGRIAKVLVHAGAEMLAVYTAGQAAELLRAAVGCPVLVLMPIREIGRADELYRSLVCGRLHLSVHDAGHLAELIRLSERYGTRIPLHVEIDTGMSRGGCSLHEAPTILRRIVADPRLELAGLYTHFASAETDDDATRRQDDRFEQLLRDCADLIPASCIIHAANTGATIRDRRYHRRMVRVGQAWAGYGPDSIVGGHLIDDAQHLQPAVTWSSEIVHLKWVDAGTPVGYGSTWVAPRRTLIGLVPVGYADGYPLSLSAGTMRARSASVAVWIDTTHGVERRFAPVVGRINMDQVTIDVTDVAAEHAGQPLSVGAVVELITPDRGAPNHLTRLAEAAGTNPYELLCRLSARIRRVYHRTNAMVEVTTSKTTAAAG